MITVVSGLPRSGTSLLMQVLQAGGLPPLTDSARAPDASNPRGYFEHERTKALARDNAWLAEADGRVVKVVVPLLRHLPPGLPYRVVLVERDLGEVLRSQSAMLRALGRPAGDPAVLRPVFARQLDEAKGWLAVQPQIEVLFVAHRALFERPPAQAARLNRFLGGALDEAAMAAAVDPALYRQKPHAQTAAT